MNTNHNTQNSYNILKTVNTFSLIIITIIDIIIFFGYISDYKQGHISFLFMFMVNCVVILSMICSYIVYLRKKDSIHFKHVSIIGYIAVYALAVFGAQNDMVFIMIFPISIVYILYFDYALILRASFVFAAINIIDVIYYVLFLKHMHSGAPLNSTSILLQAACVIMYLTVLCQTTRISNQNNSRKINNINEEKEKSAQLLLDVLSVVDAVKQNCTTAETYIRDLGQDVDTTTSTLNQIAEANSSNAQSIDRQTDMTGNIQEMIHSTKEMADQMLVLAQQSEAAVQGGQDIRTGHQTINGQEYMVGAVKRWILTPLKTGKRTITTSALTAKALVDDDAYSYYGNTVMDVELPSVSVNITVESLPGKKPSGFSGAVGIFESDAQVSATRLIVGDGATLVYAISGWGNCNNIKQPRITFGGGLKVDDIQYDSELQFSGRNIVSTYTTTYKIKASGPGTQTIVIPEFVYFNPEAKEYQTLPSRTVKINVAYGEVFEM